MKEFLKRLNNFEEYILAVLLPAMVITIFVSTFMRFTNLLILPWAEELARYFMIWILFFGISAATKKGEHFCVTVFVMKLPLNIQKVLCVVRILLMIGFTLFIARFSISVMQMQIMMGQVSPSLRLPMWTMYFSVLIGTALMTIRYTVCGIQEIRGKNQE